MYPDESNTKKKKGTNNNSSDDMINVKHVGAIVHAALTFAARQEHALLDRILGISSQKRKGMIEWQKGNIQPVRYYSIPPRNGKEIIKVEEDEKKYHAFCMGLERLDCACLQLDETLMILGKTFEALRVIVKSNLKLKIFILSLASVCLLSV